MCCNMRASVCSAAWYSVRGLAHAPFHAAILLFVRALILAHSFTKQQQQRHRYPPVVMRGGVLMRGGGDHCSGARYIDVVILHILQCSWDDGVRVPDVPQTTMILLSSMSIPSSLTDISRKAERFDERVLFSNRAARQPS